MSLKKVGTLIKQARTDAGLTQEQLARKVTGCNAADIGKAEKGEKELTQDQLKQIAKATGVTQKSLLDAAKGTTANAKASSTSSSSMSLNATEKKIITLYRKADAKTKKATMELLEEGAEETGNILTSLLGGSGGNVGNILGSLLGGSSSGSSSSSSAAGNLLGTLLGGSSSSGSNSSSGNLLGTLLGGAASVLGGKREMPEGEEEGNSEKGPELIKEL